MKTTSCLRRTTASSDHKNESQSQNFRNEGKLLHEDGKLFEALECFNRSLCVAQLKSSDIPFTYSDRSAVYLRAEQYDLCLENIRLARETGFPADKVEELDAREERCKKWMKNHQLDPDDDPWNFFKLSYPCNEKIPFIVNCLEVQKSDVFGRYIITTQGQVAHSHNMRTVVDNVYVSIHTDMMPGDIIAIEEPFYKAVNSDAAHTRCSQCLKCNKMSLIPSEYSQTAMFCSRDCMKTAETAFLQAENDSKMHDIKQRMLFEALAICGGSFDKLDALMEDEELSGKTIFDFDLSDPNAPDYKYNLLLCLNSLAQAANVSDEIFRYLSSHPILDLFPSERERAIAVKFLIRCYKTLTVNAFGIEWVVPATLRNPDTGAINTKLIGDGLCQFGSLLNHSCVPNIDRVFVDNKFVFYVRRPVKKGAQLFTCYGTLFVDAPCEKRQETLKAEYEFECECEACTNDYPSSFNYPWANIALTITPVSTASQWIQDFRKSCGKVVKHQEHLSQTEICKIMLKNLYFLVAIAKTEPFIF